MKFHCQPVIWCLAVGLISAAAVAEESTYEAVHESLSGIVPNAENVAIAETPIEGVLEVQVDSEVIYMTADGSYLLQGPLFDLKTQTNLTDQTKTRIRKAAMDELDPAQSITFTPDKPEHEIYVFTDIDCGYCRRLHSQIDQYNAAGIAVHYLMFPRAGDGSKSWDKAVSVWCADDQQTAITRAKEGREPEPAQCDNPVRAQYNLGQKMGVTGTPALLTSNGVLIPGYVPPEQLVQRLDRIASTE